MKAVLFDLFGTLVDNATVAQVNAVHGAIAAELGVPAEEYTEWWKATFHERSRGVHGSSADAIRAAASRCSVPYNEAALERAVHIRREFFRGWLTPRADAVSTLTSIRSFGYRTGLLSNCTAEVPVLWPSIALAPFIDEPLFSCVEGFRKPMSEFYVRALIRLKVSASECLYVADGDNGELAAARSLGFQVVMIRPPELLNDYRQDPEEDWDGLRIERLSDLLLLDPLQP